MLRQTSVTLSIILLALGPRAVAGLTGRGNPWLGISLAVAGIALMAFSQGLPVSRPGLRPRRRVHALLVAGAILAVSALSTPALKLVAWRFHEIRLPDTFYLAVSRALPGVARSGELLTFWTGRHLETVRITFETLGLYEVWYLVMGFAVFGALTGSRPTARSVLRGAALVGAYALLRSVVAVALAIELSRPGIMWLPLYSLLSWLPLAPLLTCREVSSGVVHTQVWRRGRALLVPIGMGLAVAFLVGYEDPGHLKQGRVLIDEAHADWEWVEEPFDTTAYGIRAEYNYYCLCEYLGNLYTVSVNSAPITSSRLDSVDVFIIKTPTEPFEPGEIDAIESFVDGGGGLLLIGDHTNLFGMSTHLNEIAERFEMRFRYDDTFDIVTTGFSRYRRPRSGFHPAVRAVERFNFLTSCSIEGGIRTRPVMVGSGLGSEDVDYGHPNFFGNITYEVRDRFGVFLLAGATTSGEGRVMLFTDSTCLSNFCMFSPGTCELALGFVDFLNRRGRRYPLARPLTLGLLAALGYAFVEGARRWSQGFLWALPGLLAGISLGLFAVAHVNATLYGPIASREVPNRVLFDTQHTTASFFTYPGIPRKPDTMGFEVLYLCAQRVGAHPCTGTLEGMSAFPPAGVVIINPSRSFSGEELMGIDAFLHGGGTLLVLDSILNGISTADQVVRPYGMSLGRVYEFELSPAGYGRWVAPRLVISGGISLSQDEQGRSRAAFVPVGRGVIVVAADSFGYSHHVLGSVLQRSSPSGPVRDIYSEIYTMLGNAIGHPVRCKVPATRESEG